VRRLVAVERVADRGADRGLSSATEIGELELAGPGVYVTGFMT